MIYKAPQKIPQYGAVGFNRKRPAIFLAGTIDMGASEDWQESFTELLVAKFGSQVDIYNPRRDNWDSTWEQKISNDKFVEQVEWELEAMESADYIIMNLLAHSVSIVSMLEMGLHMLNANKLLIHCAEGFSRKGNVDITCRFYDKKTYSSMNDILDELGNKINL